METRNSPWIMKSITMITWVKNVSSSGRIILAFYFERLLERHMQKHTFNLTKWNEITAGYLSAYHTDTGTHTLTFFVGPGRLQKHTLSSKFKTRLNLIQNSIWGLIILLFNFQSIFKIATLNAEWFAEPDLVRMIDLDYGKSSENRSFKYVIITKVLSLSLTDDER